MNIALDDTGGAVMAVDGAPALARCPHCGGLVLLRQRRRSQRPDDVTWFWRHRDNANPNCPARFSPGYGLPTPGAVQPKSDLRQVTQA